MPSVLFDIIMYNKFVVAFVVLCGQWTHTCAGGWVCVCARAYIAYMSAFPFNIILCNCPHANTVVLFTSF